MQSTYGAFEADEGQTQAGVETTAWWFWQWSPNAASDYLPQYSTWRADQALGLAQSLKAQTK